MTNRFFFRKEERLTGKKVIDQLFAQGLSFNVYPLRFVYLKTDNGSTCPARVLFTVPKRLQKKAVKRNRIKRKMREAYRLNKQNLYNELKKRKIRIILSVIYTGAEADPGYPAIEAKIRQGMSVLPGKL